MSPYRHDAVTLDGNSAAGLLGEFFTLEMTVASVTCNSCGTVTEIGATRLYGGTMGAVFRCQQCEAVVVRMTHTPRGYWLDMRGAASVFVPTPEQAEQE